MGLFDWLCGKDKGLGVEELSQRLQLPADTLRSTAITYRAFDIPKRSGGMRRILAPSDELKAVQRKILFRLLHGLKVHSAVHGFERQRSIVTNARLHAGRAVVVRMDVRDFFPSTSSKRVEAWFRFIGWNREAAKLLTSLTTHDGGLPQGAPTSPRLANLLNYRLDTRLAALAQKLPAKLGCQADIGVVYTRYADDLTFSFTHDAHQLVEEMIHHAREIVEAEGYRLHTKRKLQIRRQHQRQMVTGLVTNTQPNLPRPTRRWLRAVEHHVTTGRPASLTPQQLAGWRALQAMIKPPQA